MTKKNNFPKMLILMTLTMGAFSLALMLFATTRDQNNNKPISIDLSTFRLVQLEEPKVGDQIAIVDTTIGEVRFKLYPEYAPEAVNNFVKLAESGAYNDTYVFDAQNGAYSAMGAPNRNGSINGSYSQDSEHVERELHQNLWPFRGAVCMLNTTYDQTLKEKIFGGGTYYCGSRFIILNSVKFTEEFSQDVRDSSFSPELAEAFIKQGGIPNFSQQMTIIGQTYKGYDIVDKLASLENQENGDYLMPKEEIKVISVKIDKFADGDEIEKR